MFHRDAEVGELAEIIHAELSQHLGLEAIDVLHACSGDDEVIHIHADDELLLPSLRVEYVLRCALCEPKRVQHGVELGVHAHGGCCSM